LGFRALVVHNLRTSLDPLADPSHSFQFLNDSIAPVYASGREDLIENLNCWSDACSMIALPGRDR
jgi:hypothetical protein